MTASERPSSSRLAPSGGRSAAARALDALVYLPAGALLAALEDVPETVAKGRERVDQELRNAKVVGRFVVDLGLRQLREQLRPVAAGEASTAPPPAPRTTTTRQAAGTSSSETAAARSHPRAAHRDPEVDQAIRDYDALAASQVVRRLGGLGHDQLRAVLRHERATRGRRTVLQRAEQLLGTVPGGDTTG